MSVTAPVEDADIVPAEVEAAVDTSDAKADDDEAQVNANEAHDEDVSFTVVIDHSGVDDKDEDVTDLVTFTMRSI